MHRHHVHVWAIHLPNTRADALTPSVNQLCGQAADWFENWFLHPMLSTFDRWAHNFVSLAWTLATVRQSRLEAEISKGGGNELPIQLYLTREVCQVAFACIIEGLTIDVRQKSAALFACTWCMHGNSDSKRVPGTA